jgi:hypothetical protein
MKKYLLALGIGFLPSMGHCLGYDSGGGIPTTVSSETITALNVSSLTVTNTSTLNGNVKVGANDSGADVTVGGGASDTNPTVVIDKDNAGSGQVIFQDQGAQRAQITLDSNEALLIRTDSNQAMTFGTNSASKMTLDTSGQLNIGNTITNGNTWVNISSGNAMVAIAGSTNTAAVAGLLGSTCPAVTCTSAFTWVKWTLSATDGTGTVTVWMPVWK